MLKKILIPAFVVIMASQATVQANVEAENSDMVALVEQVKQEVEAAVQCGLTPDEAATVVASSIVESNPTLMTVQRKKELLVLLVGFALGVVCVNLYPVVVDAVKGLFKAPTP